MRKKSVDIEEAVINKDKIIESKDAEISNFKKCNFQLISQSNSCFCMFF